MKIYLAVVSDYNIKCFTTLEAAMLYYDLLNGWTELPADEARPHRWVQQEVNSPHPIILELNLLKPKDPWNIETANEILLILGDDEFSGRELKDVYNRGKSWWRRKSGPGFYLMMWNLEDEGYIVSRKCPVLGTIYYRKAT